MDSTIKHHSLKFLPLLVLAMLVTILAQAMHETGHHIVYQVMGHEPVWGFTKVVQMSDTIPINPGEWVDITYSDGGKNWLKLSSLPSGKVEEATTAAAGPLAGLFSAVIGLVMSRRSRKPTSKQVWLVYTLAISLTAVIYYLRAPMRTGGDEYDIAVSLGIAKPFVEIPLALGYLTCLVVGLRELTPWKNRFSWLVIILIGSTSVGIAMALLDPIIFSQVDEGNPWVQPVIGYSLPVFLTIILTFLGVWAWVRWQERISK